MITQTITASMTQTHLSKILTRRYDVGREIKFILYKDELLSDPIDLTDYTVVITVIKPDNNFVIENFVGDTVTITDQMEVVTGTGYYCVHVSKDNETIYTGQGEFIIDDVLISDEELESISEVNGLRFPDDFLTIDDHVAVIDDDVTSMDKTWSSSKINYEIDNTSVEVSKTVEGNPVIFTDGANAPLVKCVTAITGYQSGTGTPSPDNIRPIVAYTKGEIEVSDGDGNSTTHTTAYPSAIYRGSEDCVNGKVTAECIKVVIDGSNIAVASVANYNLNRRFSINYNSAEFPLAKYVGVSSFCLCDKIQPSFNYTIGINNNMPEVYGVFPHSSAFFITLPASVAQTTAEANTWLSENNIVICYELNTPVEVSATPTNLPVKSLNGYNHIESSTGDMDVEYITQDYQPLVDSIVMESESNKHVYSTEEQIVGTWIDGRAVYEKTIVSEFTNHAENYTLDLSEIDGTPILLIDISSAVCVYTEGGQTYTQIVQPASNNTNTYSVGIHHGSSIADTLIGYVTIRYTKSTPTEVQSNI